MSNTIYNYLSAIKDWKYYNHAVVPTTEPHIIPNLSPLKNELIWRIDGEYPLFARWTSDFDRKERSEWYYIIKDTVYEPNLLSRKKKYNINRGRKNFDVKIIEPKNYTKDISDVWEEAFKSYSSLYRPVFDKNNFINKIKAGEWDKFVVFAAFEKSTNKIGGITTISINGNSIRTVEQKSTKWGEKNRVNYALVDAYLLFFNSKIKEGYYINGGERNLYHKTNWHEIKTEYFGFRKAYCKLNIVYRPIIRPFVFILYLFRRVIKSLKEKSSLFYKINAVLEMEVIARKYRNQEDGIS